MSEDRTQELKGFFAQARFYEPWAGMVKGLFAEIDRLRADNDTLKTQLATGLHLPEVDLEGEIAEGLYLCELDHGMFGRHFNIVRYHDISKWLATDNKVASAYGPLPERGER